MLLVRIIRAVDEGVSVSCFGRESTSATILANLGSEGCSSDFGFFLLAIADDCADACLAAKAAGSSLTWAYSECIRDATLVREAVSDGAEIGSAMAGREGTSRAERDAKSAANSSRDRLADVRT